MPEGTVMAFDPGSRRIGVAIGEALLASGRSLGTLRARAGLPEWDAVTQLLERWSPAELVVGITYHADGTDAPSTEGARRLAQQLHKRYALPVHTVEERLSSREAAERIDGRRLRREPDAVHGEAAAVILETFFSRAGAA